jgi:chemotaxis protein methyltransferase CheR
MERTMPGILTPFNTWLDNLANAGGVFQIADPEFHAIREIIYREAGISLSEAKRALVCSRLAKRLRHFGLRSHAEYLDYLATRDRDGAERQEMINCLTTNKTDFFREPHHFGFLRDRIFSEIERRAAKGRPRRLRIWSAGCSTGEEPYSIAITILEHFRSLRGWDVRVLASDLNTDVLHTAEQGVYPLDRIEGVDPEVTRRYFLRGSGRWNGYCQVRPEVRRLITFRQINFMDDPWPIRTHFDAVFCRNVIIYFDGPTQRRLLPRLGCQLAEHGYLMLGHSENLHWLSGSFRPMGSTVYQLKSAAASDAAAGAELSRANGFPGSGRATSRREIVAGDCFATREPIEVSTVLGSCVAACLFDPVTRIGGMNHFMLPFHTRDTAVSARYGVHAMELLINEIMKLGGDRRRLLAKVFGGADVLHIRTPGMSIGRRNVDFIHQFLATERIPIAAKRLGGDSPLRVHFMTDTGVAFVKALRTKGNIAEREARYSEQAALGIQNPPRESVTLF